MSIGAARILFVTENLTLAQVVRLAAVAERLDPEVHEVHFACSEFDPLVFREAKFRCWTLRTAEKDASLRKLERGQRLYELDLLRTYVAEELALFDQVRPDLIVGDFRLSLSVSAPHARIPFATLINAYWSPFAVRDAFPMPDHPLVTLFGAKLAARYFPLAAPYVFAHFAAPINALRELYQLPPIGSLFEVLTFGDYTLYPDIPELCPTSGLPPRHLYLGAIPWAPDVELPAEAARLVEGARPFVYVTLGSSGQVRVLGAVLEGLLDLGLEVLVATAGRVSLDRLPQGVHAVDYVPGDRAAAAATFVVTNGGSTTGYQALTQGKPVLGVPSNLDQYLAMGAIERAGVGLGVRAGGLTAAQVGAAARTLLDSPSFFERARAMARAFAQRDCHDTFQRFLQGALPARRPEHGTPN